MTSLRQSPYTKHLSAKNILLKIIIFTHPSFLTSYSMPRFAHLLINGMKERGHRVSYWTAAPFFYNLPVSLKIKKWLGYIDQFILFPIQTRFKLLFVPKTTLFVFADQALGPWVPLVKNRPHVVHCHDFIAQRSALGIVKENPTSFSGKLYQGYIRWGYRKAKNFISISENTQRHLHEFLVKSPKRSEVVYNGLNQPFTPTNDIVSTRKELGNKRGINLENGYILHVGGNQFYKNRIGVIQIYEAWALNFNINNIPLLLVGAQPNEALVLQQLKAKNSKNIHFLTELSNAELQLAYQGASVLVYPSLYEGFGWPIAEAMASGCSVITTGEAPMNEVAGNAAYYLPKKPIHGSQKWAEQAAKTLQEVIGLDDKRRATNRSDAIEQAKRFNTQQALDSIEQAYIKILND